MRLLPNWRGVLARAWSLRLLALSLALSGLEVAIGVFGDAPPLGLPRNTFAALAGAVTIAAGVARLVAQRPLSGEPS